MSINLLNIINCNLFFVFFKYLNYKMKLIDEKETIPKNQKLLNKISQKLMFIRLIIT